MTDILKLLLWATGKGEVRRKIRVFRLFGFTVWKEPPGVISEGACWICCYSMYMHCCGGFWELIYNVITEYKSEHHICG